MTCLHTRSALLWIDNRKWLTITASFCNLLIFLFLSSLFRDDDGVKREYKHFIEAQFVLCYCSTCGILRRSSIRNSPWRHCPRKSLSFWSIWAVFVKTCQANWWVVCVDSQHAKPCMFILMKQYLSLMCWFLET